MKVNEEEEMKENAHAVCKGLIHTGSCLPTGLFIGVKPAPGF